MLVIRAIPQNVYSKVSKIGGYLYLLGMSYWILSYLDPTISVFVRIFCETIMVSLCPKLRGTGLQILKEKRY